MPITAKRMIGAHRIDWQHRRPAATGGGGAKWRSLSDRLRRDARAFVRSIRERGLLSSLHIGLSTLWCAFLDQLDERIYRTNTSGGVPIASLEIPSENKTHSGPYSTPSQFRIMKKAFKAVMELRGPGSSTSTLIDFGCGKGRVLMAGSEFGFQRLIGVEFAPELCREAEAAICAYVQRTRKPFRFQVVNADATRFAIPPEADVFYFFAFDGYVLDQVAQNILQSTRESPRPVWAIYVKAIHDEVFTARGFRVVRELRWSGWPTRIYALDSGPRPGAEVDRVGPLPSEGYRARHPTITSPVR